MWIENKYASLLSSKLRNYKVKNNSPYLSTFSCPLCGDSQKNKNKTRGYFYTGNNDKLRFICHNCGASLPFTLFLKRIDPLLYKNYIYEVFSREDKKPQKKQEEKEPEKVENKDFLSKYCTKVSELKPTHIAMKYLIERKIPKEAWEDLYFIDDLSKLKEEFPQYDKLPADGRIVIPIKNRSNELIGMTARALDKKSKLRYVILKKSDEPLLFNWNRAKLDQKVYVTEGAFDSMFLPNSVAVTGADFHKILNKIPKDKLVVIFDNQPRNIEIINKMKKISEDGYNIVVWPRDLSSKGKDINELILSGMTQEEIKKLIDSRTFKGLQSKLEIAKWRVK